MRLTVLAAATLIAAAPLALPATAGPPDELSGSSCGVTTSSDPSPGASADSQLLVIHAEWVDLAANRMVLTCTVRAGDGDRVVVRSIGGNGVALIPPYATTMEMPYGEPVYVCSHATWYDASGYHEEGPDCLVISSGTDG